MSSWAFLMLGSLMSTCSCIWLWLYCTTPACDFPGSNCVGTGVRSARPAAPPPCAGGLGFRLWKRRISRVPSPVCVRMHPAPGEPPSGDQGGTRGWGPAPAHLDQLVPAQPVDDLDDEVLGDLEVLQPDALGAVQHEEDVDGAALALWAAGGGGGGGVSCLNTPGTAPSPTGQSTQSLKSDTHHSKLQRAERDQVTWRPGHTTPPTSSPPPRPGSASAYPTLRTCRPLLLAPPPRTAPPP